MYIIYLLGFIALIAVVDLLWSAPRRPTEVSFVPKTGLELTASGKTAEPLRHQIVNLRWRINT